MCAYLDTDTCDQGMCACASSSRTRGYPRSDELPGNTALRAMLEDAASKSGRSLTAETEYRLQGSFDWERAFAAGMVLDDDDGWFAAVRERLAASARRYFREGLQSALPLEQVRLLWRLFYG